MNALTFTPRRFTSAEFTRLAQSGGFGRLRVELRRGWMVEMSPQFTRDARMKMKVLSALEEAIEVAGLPFAVWTEVSVNFGAGFQPMPDIIVFDPALAPEDLEGPLPATAVRLVVEVADSSLADDLGDKRAEYAETGLAEYWVVDVTARVLHRHATPEDRAFTRVETAPLADGAQSLTLPGVAVAAGVLS
jgi:Uma2 family endonuclease